MSGVSREQSATHFSGCALERAAAGCRGRVWRELPRLRVRVERPGTCAWRLHACDFSVQPGLERLRLRRGYLNQYSCRRIESARRAADAPSPAPSAQGGVRLRVLQWNLHHGVGTDGKYDIDRIATWIARMDPDVVTLNEVEKNTYWGREDQPARYEAMLEAKTGKRWHAVFAQEFGDWTSNGKGHLILSTVPNRVQRHGGNQLRPCHRQARIIVNGRTVSLIVTHLDPESATRRLTQAQQVTRWASAVPENRISRAT